MQKYLLTVEKLGHQRISPSILEYMVGTTTYASLSEHSSVCIDEDAHGVTYAGKQVDSRSKEMVLGFYDYHIWVTEEK